MTVRSKKGSILRKYMSEATLEARGAYRDEKGILRCPTVVADGAKMDGTICAGLGSSRALARATREAELFKQRINEVTHDPALQKVLAVKWKIYRRGNK